MTARTRRPVRGVLLFVAALLAGSGILRVGLGLTQAQAVPAAQPEVPPPQSCPAAPGALIEALAERSALLDTRDAAIEDRLAALDLAEAALRRRLDDLQAAEAALSATLAKVDGAAENDLARLTAVYEAMKPKEAADLFQTMAPDFAAGFLARMRPEAAAAVLSGMAPETAYAISVLLAGRNALAPRN
jgi:flagellar motility protein MotE (MotC chaperone)